MTVPEHPPAGRTPTGTAATAPTVVAPSNPAWTDASRAARLHVVSGKGGTGKTTVAAALALALAAEGAHVLLVEVEERQGIAQLFGTLDLPPQERRLTVTDTGGSVDALAVTVDEAMLEYLATHFALGFAGKAMRKVGAIEFATTIAPGLKDVILTGKIKECVERTGPSGRPAYDAIVLDAPPTGRIGPFLDVTTAMADLAQGGPIRAQAETVIRLFHSAQTVVHLVTLPESMPVQETLDAVAELQGLGLRMGSVIVNRAYRRHLDDAAIEALADGAVDAAELRRGLAAAGLDPDGDDLGGLLVEGIEYATTFLAQLAAVAALADGDLPRLVLPDVIGGVDPTRLDAFADRLRHQGVRHG